MKFDFTSSDKNPYGFTVQPPFSDCEPSSEQLHAETEYLCVSFDRPERDLHYLFDKNRNHISWQKRADEVKNILEVREYPDAVVIEGLRTVDFHDHDSGIEGWDYKLYKDGELIMTGSAILEVTIDDKYKGYLEHKRWKDEQETERKAVVEALLDLQTIEEQKYFVGQIVIRDVDMSIFYGPVRDCGPIKEFPFDRFSDKFRELDNDLLEELFIHAQTIFALYMNEGECYPGEVDVESFVNGKAEKFGTIEAYEKYFDKNTELGDLWGLC